MYIYLLLLCRVGCAHRSKRRSLIDGDFQKIIFRAMPTVGSGAGEVCACLRARSEFEASEH
jgi:hypothetical protein